MESGRAQSMATVGVLQQLAHRLAHGFPSCCRWFDLVQLPRAVAMLHQHIRQAARASRVLGGHRVVTIQSLQMPYQAILNHILPILNGARLRWTLNSTECDARHMSRPERQPTCRVAQLLKHIPREYVSAFLISVENVAAL